MSKYEHIHNHHLRHVAQMLEALDACLDIEVEILTTSGQSDEGIKHILSAKRSIKNAASLVDDGDHLLAIDNS